MYIFPDEARKAIEAMPVPLAYYQRADDGSIVATIVSDGLCQMMGADRENLTRLLNGGLFERVHPDDAGRLARIVREFADRLCGYDVIYRGKYTAGGDYHYIHSIGKFQPTPDGSDLAMFVYTDISASQSESSMLVEHYELFKKDHFYTDPVTGLPNGNYLHEFADEKVDRIRAGGNAAALLYLDVRGLRSYNSQYGYARGDDLLRLIADVLTGEFPGAMIARGADDHFIVITAYADADRLSARIDSVNRKVRTGAYGNTTGIQAGICLYDATMDTVTAMDFARHAHRQIGDDLNETFHIYANEDGARYWNQRYIVESFDRALEQGWIKVFYQGITRLETGKSTVQEALARWVDPNRGIISPGEFIPVLEKFHLLYKLDLYMAEQVCREIPLRAEAGLLLLPVSINFSGQDFDYVDVAAELDRLYDQYGIAQYVGKDYFIVEITEQDMATATGHFQEQLKRLRASGYKLWLDDFGSGYSSLSMFSRFDFNLIKFDMDLLRHLDDHDGANRRIIKAMIGVARELGIHTLVEGMETESQRQFLREVGCELAQGFLFHRPEPLDAILYRRKKGQKSGPCETPEEREALIQKWFDM